MRKTVLLFILLVAVCGAFAQKVDSAPSGNRNFLPVEGGSLSMTIDSTSSLDSLIGRLSSNWWFLETGKAYWIGYTADMFSIAARGDKAIPALVSLLQHSQSWRARYGAIFTLHLIGINSSIAGRFHEEFVNPKARTALLSFLKDTTLQESIMRLLIRDPWHSDIPAIMDALQECKIDPWALVSGLSRYRLAGAPMRQPIPERVKNAKVEVNPPDSSWQRNYSVFDTQIKKALAAFKDLHSKDIIVEDSLFVSPLVGDYSTSGPEGETEISYFLWSLDFDKFSSLGTRLQYYVDGERLVFCTSETGKKRWLRWWQDLSEEQRASWHNKP